MSNRELVADETVFCEWCGEESGGDLLCDSCEEQSVPCTDCGEVLNENDAQYREGEYYCESCYNKYVYCSHCDNLVLSDNCRIDMYEEALCSDCTRSCNWCQNIISPDHVYRDSHNNELCPDCEEEAHRCHRCDCYLHSDDVNSVGDADYCYDCINEVAVHCEDCNELVLEEIAVHVGRRPICPPCIADNYSWCDSCDVHYPADDDCPDCAGAQLHRHGYKPSPVFYPSKQSNTLFMGVELEVDDGRRGTLPDLAKLLRGWDSSHFYLKEDSSLNNGLEIVTHPMTLDYHLHAFSWDDLCKKVRVYNFFSHNTETCGLHIHMSRDAFTEASLMKFLFIIERFWDKWIKFSRRTAEQLERWADRYGVDDFPDVLYNVAVKSRSKYRAVNLLNQDTVEIRFFKGTLKHTTIKAALQLCDHLYHVAITHSVEEVMAFTWDDITDGVPSTYEELNKYLVAHNLK